MSDCWDEGALRAYFDRELPAGDLPRIAAHLGECAECHARYNELAGRASRVSAFMNALTPAAYTAPTTPAQRRPRWVRPVAGAALALAAAVALAFVLIPKRVAPPAPVARPHVPKPARPIQAEAVAPAARPAAAEKRGRAKSARPKKAAQPEYFLALDDDPIDMGVVMRVAVAGAASVQADVIFDADGRPRAIRPVSNSK